jgi:hypothetical protein
LVAIAGVLLVFSTKPLLTLKIGHHPSQRFLWGAIAGLIILGGSFRAYRGIKYTARAMNERAVEHLPVAKFIRTFYNADTIILGDIGMVTYLTEAKVLDVFGLANRDSCVEILQARSTAEVGKVGAEFLSQWQKTRAAKLAVIRSNWVRSIPSDWIRVATFKIDSNIVFGDISPLIFFAFDRDAASELRDNLQTFGAAEAISGRLHLTL